MAVDTAQVHDRREILIREGEGLSSGTSSVNNSIKFGAYEGRLANLRLAGINNPSPNLTTAYLDTPLVGPTPEPLEYVPSPGCLGQPSGYPPTILQEKSSRRRTPTPPPPYNTHPRMHPPTGRAQPRRVLHATGPYQNLKTLATREETLVKFWPQGLERPNPPTHTYGHRGEGREATGVQGLTATGPYFFTIQQLRGNPWRKFGCRDWKVLTPTHTPTGTGGGGREAIGDQAETVIGPGKFEHLENRGEPLVKFLSPDNGVGGHMPHPPPHPYPPGRPPPSPPPTHGYHPG